MEKVNQSLLSPLFKLKQQPQLPETPPPPGWLVFRFPPLRFQSRKAANHTKGEAKRFPLNKKRMCLMRTRSLPGFHLAFIFGWDCCSNNSNPNISRTSASSGVVLVRNNNNAAAVARVPLSKPVAVRSFRVPSQTCVPLLFCVMRTVACLCVAHPKI